MFTDANHLWPTNRPSKSRGVAVADLDGDGRFEFFLGADCEANRLWKWNGTQLEDATPKELAAPKSATVAVAAGDIDGDGREELYLHHSDVPSGVKSQADQLMKCGVQRIWEDLFHTALSLRNFYTARTVIAMDRRGTGRYGFLAGILGKPMRLYVMVPDRQLADLAPPIGLNAICETQALWAGPLVSERIDVLCGIEGGGNGLFVSEKGPGFREFATVLNLADVKETTCGLAAFDADDDGLLDVALGNWDGPNRLMIRQPDGTFKDRATPAMAMPGLVKSVIAADFDNDGYEELFYQFHGESNRLFRRNTTGEWRMIDPGAAASSQGSYGASVADIDGDGVLELLLLQDHDGLFKVPEAKKNHWLRILPETRFGAPARGAMVRLSAGGRTQVRVIDGGSLEPIAHFGLGRIERAESVRVLWPDGANATLSDVDARQVVRVPYPHA